jgi:MFS family permease
VKIFKVLSKINDLFMYKHIFASSYKYYSKFKNEAPYVSSICVVFISQITLFVLLGVLVDRYIVEFFPRNSGYKRIYGLPFVLLWLGSLFLIFPKTKVPQILQEFNNKPLKVRKAWALVSLIHLILPVVLVFIVLLNSK